MEAMEISQKLIDLMTKREALLNRLPALPDHTFNKELRKLNHLIAIELRAQMIVEGHFVYPTEAV